MSDQPEMPGIGAAGSAPLEEFLIVREGVNADVRLRFTSAPRFTC